MNSEYCVHVTEFVRCLFVLLTLSLLSIVAQNSVIAGETDNGTAQAAASGEPQEFWRTYLAWLDKESRASASPSHAYDRQLLYVANVRDTQDEFDILKSVLDRIDAAGRPDSVPALTALLNVPYGSSEAINAVRERASDLWYKLRWPAAKEQEKIEMALYGLRPEPPVQLSPESSLKMLHEIGFPARAPFYALLQDPSATYRKDHVVMYRAADLMKEKAFAPTDADIARLLDSAGNYGKVVTIIYLAERQDSRAIPAIVAQLKTKNNYWWLDRIATCAEQFQKGPEKDKAPLNAALIGLGQNLLEVHDREMDSQSELLATVNRTVAEFGQTPQSEAYLRKYLDFHKTITIQTIIRIAGAGTNNIYGVLANLESAQRRAQTALDGWSSKKMP